MFLPSFRLLASVLRCSKCHRPLLSPTSTPCCLPWWRLRRHYHNTSTILRSIPTVNLGVSEPACLRYLLYVSPVSPLAHTNTLRQVRRPMARTKPGEGGGSVALHRGGAPHAGELRAGKIRYTSSSVGAPSARLQRTVSLKGRPCLTRGQACQFLRERALIPVPIFCRTSRRSGHGSPYSFGSCVCQLFMLFLTPHTPFSCPHPEAHSRSSAALLRVSSRPRRTKSG